MKLSRRYLLVVTAVLMCCASGSTAALSGSPEGAMNFLGMFSMLLYFASDRGRTEHPIVPQTTTLSRESFLFTEFIESTLSIGLSVLAAIEEFYKFIKAQAGKHRAVLQVEIQNLANVSMNEGEVLANWGTIKDDIPLEVSPGTKEAFTIKQNKPLTGVQIAAHWGIQDDRMVVIATEAWQQAAWRKPNKLGVLLLKTPAHLDDFATWQSIIPMQQYDKKISFVRYCDEKYCIMANMSNYFQSNVTVRIFPRCIDALDHQFLDQDNLPQYQHALDAILGVSTPSCNGTSGPGNSARTDERGVNLKIWLPTLLTVMVLAVVIAVAVVKYRRTDNHFERL